MLHEEKFKQSLVTNKAFMAKRIFDLHLLILKQAEQVYQTKEMIFPVAVSSTLLFLASVKSASLAQTAKALGQPHQLIAQRIKTLLKLKLIVSSPDKNDKRRTLYKLTKLGKSQHALLDEYCLEAEVAFNDLSNELGIDLHHLLNRTYESLETKTFAQRFPSYQE
jgi:DNA-binding MarR family transcriptional regulator